MLRRLALGLLFLCAVGQVACVDPKGGGTAGTSVYLHSVEGTTAKVYVYADAEALFSASETPAPDHAITSGLFSQAVPLAWGGMVMDPQTNRLYLVGESGSVVRVDRVRSQSGDISSTSSDAVSFTLGSSSSDRLSSGKFGQAFVDPSSGSLYVCESNDSESRIWIVSNPGTLAQGAAVTRQSPTFVSGDKGCWGVAYSQGQLYAYFNDGSPVGLNGYTGPRLRKGDNTGFAGDSNVLVGDSTQLAKYGSLALDTSNSYLYVARHLQDSGKSGQPILKFRSGTFSGSSNQPPDGYLGDGSDTQSSLRVISHAGNKDWLAGLTSSSEKGTNVFWLWKAPGGTDAQKPVIKRTLPNAGEVRGLAFDGNN